MAEATRGSAPEGELEEAPAPATKAFVVEGTPTGKQTAAGAQAQASTLNQSEPAGEAGDNSNASREALMPRRSRPGKVMTNGFRMPGFSGFSDLSGKVCVKCGFNAMKFSKQCPRCGGDLVPEGAPTS